MVRQRILRISASLLVQFLQDGTGLVEVIENPLPPDARIVDVHFPFSEPGIILLKIESETFDWVRFGESFPVHPDVVFRRVVE